MSCPFEAGKIYEFDFRPSLSPSLGEDLDNHPKSPLHPLKCVQWNIERGYKLDDIKQLLRQEEADIVCLQELDIGCERSQRRNCAVEIAEALKMKCVFLVEFEELFSPLREEDTQGGGVHGNAILSRFDLDPYIVEHIEHPLNWAVEGHFLGEPRVGQRAILAARVKVPGLPTEVICYCLHLEVFCGILGRLKQFSDVLENSNDEIAERENYYQIIMGDLNTMAHGLARLSPKYCRDFLRIWSLGSSEGSFWYKYLFNVLHNGSKKGINHKLFSLYPRHFSLRQLQNLRNNYFYDPYCVHSDMTLSNYQGCYLREN